MANQQIHGYILHRRPYRETSFLVDVFSIELGKCRFVAKGVRSPKSDRKSVLQPFQYVQCELSGKGEMKNLIRAEVLEKPHQLTAERLFCGMYVNELINRCLPEHILCPDLLTQYVVCLQQLQALSGNTVDIVKERQEQILREFELALLDELGYLPDLGVDALSQEFIQVDQAYVFQPEIGIVAAQHYPHLRQFSGALLTAVLQQEWSAQSLQLAKYLTRFALSPLLGNKPLKSRELFVTQS